MNTTYVILFQIRPGREQEFLDLLHPVLDAMRHEATFRNAFLHRDPEHPSRYMLYETWSDHQNVVEVQMQRDYRQAYVAALPELLAEPRQISVWHTVRTDSAIGATE